MTSTRKDCCSGTAPCRPETLKEALDCLAHHSARTVEQMADLVGSRPGTLGKQLSKWDEDNYPPLRLVVPLTLASGKDTLLHFFAESVGGHFSRDAEPSIAVDGVSVARMLREFGELLEALSSAMADGRVTETEVARVEREWADVARVSAGVREQLRRAAVSGGGV